MFYGRNKTSLTNIRSGPGAGFTDIGDLFLNDLIEADRKQKDANGVDWWHMTKIMRANGTVFPLPAVDAWCWGTNIEELLPPPDPEPGVTITGVRYSGEVVFDYSNGTQEVWHISDAPLTKGPA
jgi:hypothetical protein